MANFGPSKQINNLSSTKKGSIWLRLFSAELIVVTGLFLFSVFIFGTMVTRSVFIKNDFFDSQAFDFFSGFRTGEHTRIALFITFFGTGGFLIPAYLLIGFFLWKKGEKIYAIQNVAIALISLLLGLLLKEVFKRDRPAPPNLDGAGGYSFPSGHALGAFTFSGLMIYLVWKSSLSTVTKWIASLLLFGFALLIAMSRIYLHVHFATDTIGSFLLALIWLSLSFICMHFIRERILHNK
jgi:undecaprenyl-diphosphatase